MRKFLSLFLLVIIAELFLHQCANPLRPTGGPKDTIPPKLIYSFPVDQTINFKEQEIRLGFDEFINADQIKQKLIITPAADIEYKHLIKKRDLIIKFEKPLPDSTTFTLNFADAIRDITERNPAENLILAISTGTFIDSLTLSGQVNDLYTDQPIAKITVGLYPITDSLDFTLHKPYYFINTLKDGTFHLQNLKAGKYMVMAFNDENNNLKFDPSTESYSFLPDTFNTRNNPDSLILRQIKVDASPLKFISARPSGKYFEVRYAKPLNKYQVTTLDSSDLIYSNLTEDMDAIRFYNYGSTTAKDSVGVIISASDSLKNTSIDTVYAKYRKSARKPAKFNYTIIPSSNNTIEENTKYKLKFDKPIASLDSNFAFLKLDTLYQIDLQSENLIWNHNFTELSFDLNLSEKFYLDTLQKLIEINQPDTANIDTALLIIHNTLSRIPTNKVILNINKESFISVDGDTTKALKQPYAFLKTEAFGAVNINITTEHPSYFVQLINNKGAVQAQLYNCQQCKFQQIPPDQYSVRILIDQNQNQKWDLGNILKLEQPEPILHFPEKSVLRSNWLLELEYSF